MKVKQMDNSIQNYFHYASQVLGIRQIIRPETESEVSAIVKDVFTTRTGHWPESKRFDVLVINVTPGQSLFADSVFELYQKMKYAMGLNALNVLELQTSEIPTEHQWNELFHRISAKAVLVFAGVGDAQHLVGYDGFIVQTISPVILIEQELLKRQAWTDAQRLMRFLGV